MQDLLVFSHLRWDFVFQRPQHLLSRTARDRRVYFMEEPSFEAGIAPTLEMTLQECGVTRLLPKLPLGLTRAQVETALEELTHAFVEQCISGPYIAWYYTPMALAFSRRLKPAAVVYDCMDELSNFKGAPPELCVLENELFARADVVFTGGISLYEHKLAKHRNIHPFPSSVDIAHFASARGSSIQPQDQKAIPSPRIGYAGVIDERFDIELIRAVARHGADWQFVFIGPVVKIDPASLPRAPNVHYLGARSYTQLPAYLAGWDVGLLPFARNEATRFISPTKTPEYLAAGLKVVSTSIRDVVRGYGDRGLVSIADDPPEFAAAIERLLAQRDDTARLKRVDEVLAGMSWEQTHAAMWRQIEKVLVGQSVLKRGARSAQGTPAGVSPSPSAGPPVIATA